MNKPKTDTRLLWKLGIPTALAAGLVAIFLKPIDTLVSRTTTTEHDDRIAIVRKLEKPTLEYIKSIQTFRFTQDVMHPDALADLKKKHYAFTDAHTKLRPRVISAFGDSLLPVYDRALDQAFRASAAVSSLQVRYFGGAGDLSPTTWYDSLDIAQNKTAVAQLPDSIGLMLFELRRAAR